MRGDNIEPVPPWVYRWDQHKSTNSWTAADPLTVEEPPAQQLTRDRSRDTLLLCVAGMVIIAIAAYVAGTRS